MSKVIVSAWAKFFDDNDLQWLVKLDPEKQALIKKAFFAGVEAAQQSVHPTLATSCENHILYVACGYKYCPNCGNPLGG